MSGASGNQQSEEQVIILDTSEPTPAANAPIISGDEVELVKTEDSRMLIERIDKERAITIKRTKIIPRLVVGIMLVITVYLNLWAWNKVASILLSHYFGREIFLLPLVFGKFNSVSVWIIPFISAIAIFTWLLSTRVVQWSTYTKKFIILVNTISTITGFLAAYGMGIVEQQVLPFFYERITRVIDTSSAVDEALFSQAEGFFFSLLLLPLILLAFIVFFINTKYRQHEMELKRAFVDFKWHGEKLRKFENLGKVENVIIPYPDIELGLNRKTNEMVVLPGFDRTLNTIITGSIGTGKTAALALPVIKQDLDNISRFINMFPVNIKRDNYFSEEIQGRFINGLSVIEPSNDLCKKVYKLAKAHNIPDEAITYIDPTNPNTVSINPMKGPTDKVSEVFTQVISGLADNGGSGNFYFEQAQRNHLKHHIYLLKEHDPSKEVTFDMLIDMYNNTSLVHEMHMALKARFPKDFELIDKVKYRDEYNSWQILKGIDEWFDKVVVPKEERTAHGNQKVRDEEGKEIYIDALEMDVKGLRNILNDIGANILIRRVLFGPSTFDFDKHMGSIGGVLLVNTAKGQLEQLGSVLGKIVLMSLQNASFRREPNVSTFHHILIDEAPEYLYSSFASFPAQSRKFKVIITMLQQTLTQLRGAFGEDYMNTVVSTMRNRMVYADVSNFDGEYFSGMFGEKEVFKEGETEQQVSPLQDDPGSRSGSTYSKMKEASLSSSDILFQEAFECAVKIVVNNKSMPVQQIKANFVPQEEFEFAKSVQVSPEAAAEWIRARFDDTFTRLVDDTVTVVEPLDRTLPSHIEDMAVDVAANDEQVIVEESSLSENESSNSKLGETLPEKPTNNTIEPPNYKPKNNTVAFSVPSRKINYSNEDKPTKDIKKPKEEKTSEVATNVEIPQKEIDVVKSDVYREIELERSKGPNLKEQHSQENEELEEIKPLEVVEISIPKVKSEQKPTEVDEEEIKPLETIKQISQEVAEETEQVVTNPKVEQDTAGNSDIKPKTKRKLSDTVQVYTQSELDDDVKKFKKRIVDEKK